PPKPTVHRIEAHVLVAKSRGRLPAKELDLAGRGELERADREYNEVTPLQLVGGRVGRGVGLSFVHGTTPTSAGPRRRRLPRGDQVQIASVRPAPAHGG